MIKVKRLSSGDTEKKSVSLKAVDATFHSGLTYYGAGINQPDGTGETMTDIFIKDGVTFDSFDGLISTRTSFNWLNNGDIINIKIIPVLI